MKGDFNDTNFINYIFGVLILDFDDFISYGNIYLAFKRLQTTYRDYYKNLYWNDLYNFGLDIEKNINTLIYLSLYVRIVVVRNKIILRGK